MTSYYKNEIDRVADMVDRDDPLVRNILFSVARMPSFHDSGVRLMYELARRKGIDPSRKDALYKYIDPQKVAGPIIIGTEKYHGLPVGLCEKELGESVFIAGRPGTLKTALLETLCLQWIQLGNKIFMISQKRDFLGLVKVVPNCCVLDAQEDFEYNPLEPPCPSSANRHAQMIANVMRKNFGSFLSGEVSFYQAVDSLYKKFGVYDGKTEEYPTMFDVLEYVQNQYTAQYTEAARAKERLIKRLSLLCQALNKTINCSRGIPIREMMENNIILLVDRLNPELRDFIVECVLISMFTYRIEHGERL